jgi:hypothetical protein
MNKSERAYLLESLTDLDDTTKGILFYMGFSNVEDLVDHLALKEPRITDVKY